MAVEITYFVHGTTLDNLDHKSTGWNHGELSEKGINQSKELVNLIKDKHFEVVISSDLKRAVDSAALNFPDREILQDERIRECNYGDLNGSSEELVIYADHITEPFPNGESLIDVENRIKDFANYLLTNFNNKKVALVAHKAPQLAFEVICNNKTWEQAIENDWRKTKSWQPGWIYVIGENENKTLKVAQKVLDVTGKTITGVANFLWNTGKKAAQKGDELIKGAVEEHKSKIAFKQQSYEYEIVGQNAFIQAFRDNIEDSCVFFKQNDKNEKFILSGSILKNVEDNSKIVITAIEKKKVEQKTIIVDNLQKQIPCYKAKFAEYKETTKFEQNITTNQTINLEAGATVNGDINQINNLEKLNQIEKELSAYQPNLFKRSQKAEAIKLFGSFKNCVLNNQKDETLFNKFLKIISDILPSLVIIVKSFM